ncbi:YicC/YloC family endoribonuclease [Pandoraea sp. NPDC087047]|uniref:YicC/YloC family endoribonuclease n=1 Tax=Pandoraea sp. NPDC087047 TaxID=3364390 RepID=UPI003804F7C7
MKDNNIYSMTGYASVTRDIAHADGVAGASVSVELRTVNSRFLDLAFRMPEEARACEPVLREALTAKLSRGKVDIRINVQRPESGTNGALNIDAVKQLADLEQQVLALFPDAERMRTGEILRWPGVLGEESVTAEALRDAVIDAGRAAIGDLVDVRRREGAQLKGSLIERIEKMETILTGLQPLVPELIARHQQKIVDRLQEALGVVVPEGSAAPGKEEIAERIRQEVTMYGVRIDVAEELTRLDAHLKETRHILDKGGLVGKRLDFMMQELNREANTLGSKAASKELADASMELKLYIEQMREQVQNLE